MPGRLELREPEKSYGSRRALCGVSLRVGAGEMVGFVGAIERMQPAADPRDRVQSLIAAQAQASLARRGGVRARPTPTPPRRRC